MLATLLQKLLIAAAVAQFETFSQETSSVGVQRQSFDQYEGNVDYPTSYRPSCLKKPQHIKVGVLDPTALPGVGFIQQDPVSKQIIGGFEYDLASNLCDFAGVTCTFHKLQNYEDRITYIQESKVDIVVMRLSYSLHRKLKIAFIEPFYYADNVQLYFPGAAPPEGYEDNPTLADVASSFVVCMLRGHYFEHDMKRVAAGVVICESYEEVVQKVHDGQCGVAASDATDSKYFKENNLHLRPHQLEALVNPYGIGVAYHRQELISTISKALTQLFVPKPGSNQAIIQALEEKWLLSSIPGLEPSTYIAGQVYLQSVLFNSMYGSKLLIVGVVASQELEPFRTWDGWSPTGFEPALMMHICEKLHRICEFIPLDTLQQRIEFLSSSKIDVVASSMSVTIDRMRSIRFVEPFYYSSPAMFFAKKRRSQRLSMTAKNYEGSLAKTFQNRVVCLTRGYHLQNVITKALGDMVKVKLFDSFSGVSSLTSRECDVTVQDGIYQYQHQQLGVHAVENLKLQIGVPYGLGMSYDTSKDLLYNQISAVMQQMVSGPVVSELEALIDKELVQATNGTIKENTYVKSLATISRVDRVVTCPEQVLKGMGL